MDISTGYSARLIPEPQNETWLIKGRSTASTTLNPHLNLQAWRCSAEAIPCLTSHPGMQWHISIHNAEFVVGMVVGGSLQQPCPPARVAEHQKERKRATCDRDTAQQGLANNPGASVTGSFNSLANLAGGTDFCQLKTGVPWKGVRTDAVHDLGGRKS